MNESPRRHTPGQKILPRRVLRELGAKGNHTRRYYYWQHWIYRRARRQIVWLQAALQNPDYQECHDFFRDTVLPRQEERMQRAGTFVSLGLWLEGPEN